jgi:hypothetical protein
MAVAIVKPRLFVGKLPIVTGIALFIPWAGYFIQLVRPIDVWDFRPLPAAFAVIPIGVKVAPRGRLRELIRVTIYLTD